MALQHDSNTRVRGQLRKDKWLWSRRIPIWLTAFVKSHVYVCGYIKQGSSTTHTNLEFIKSSSHRAVLISFRAVKCLVLVFFFGILLYYSDYKQEVLMLQTFRTRACCDLRLDRAAWRRRQRASLGRGEQMLGVRAPYPLPPPAASQCGWKVLARSSSTESSFCSSRAELWVQASGRWVGTILRSVHKHRWSRKKLNALTLMGLCTHAEGSALISPGFKRQ